MKILDLYIGRNFLKFFAMIIVIPGVLFGFFELLSELDVVGKGSYTMADALLFIILTSPGRFLYLVPITALLAGIAALGRMADHSELVAMEAAGLSVLRISLSVLGASGVIMAVAVVSGELLVPPLEQNARIMRARAVSVRGVTFTQKGFWARRGSSFVHVAHLIGKDAAEDIDIFSFDEKGSLKTFVHAQNAVITGKDHWVLYNVTKKVVRGMAVETGTVDHLDLESFLSQDQVSALELPPETLSTPELLDYIQALEKSGQNADHYRLALWRKMSQPLSTGAMVMLALSFVFGSIRKRSAGLRITIGSFVGIALYFFDQITMHAGLMVGLNPAVVAFIPFLVITSLALIRLRRAV